MSINIIAKAGDEEGSGATLIAQTICDDCKTVLGERPAEPGERPGVTLLVCDWCKDCYPRHSFPMGLPMYHTVGMGIGNHKAVAKVTIEG